MEFHSPGSKFSLNGRNPNDSSFSYFESGSEPRTRLQRRSHRNSLNKETPQQTPTKMNDYSVNSILPIKNITADMSDRQRQFGYSVNLDDSSEDEKLHKSIPGFNPNNKSFVCFTRRPLKSHENVKTDGDEFEESRILDLMEAASISGVPLVQVDSSKIFPAAVPTLEEIHNALETTLTETPNKTPTMSELGLTFAGTSTNLRERVRTSLDKLKESSAKVDALQKERERADAALRLRREEEERKLKEAEEKKKKEEEELKAKLKLEEDERKKKEQEEKKRKEQEEVEKKKKEEEKEEAKKAAETANVTTVKLASSISPAIIITTPTSPLPSPLPTKPEFEDELKLLVDLRNTKMASLKEADKNFYNTIIKLSKSTINKVSNQLSRIETAANDIKSKLSEIRSSVSLSDKDAWANLLSLKLADTVIDSLGELKMGENPSAVFCKAHFIVLAFKDDSKARQILLARLVEESPSCVPRPTKVKEEDRKNEALMQRKSELMAMYTCLKLSIHVKAGDIAGVWKWFAKMANKEVDVLELESVALAFKFLGFAPARVYKKQFEKIVKLFRQDYLNEVSKKFKHEKGLCDFGVAQLSQVIDEEYVKPGRGKEAMMFAKPDDFEPVLEVQKIEDAGD